MEKYNLIIKTTDNKVHQFKPDDFMFEVVTKNTNKVDVDLDIIDRLTSSVENSESLLKRFGISGKVKECYIRTSDKDKRLRPIFNNSEWLELSKKAKSKTFIDDSSLVRNSLISGLPDYFFGSYSTLYSDKKTSFNTDDVVDSIARDYIESLFELNNVVDDDFLISSAIADENSQNRDLLFRILNRYDALRHLYTKRESFYEMIEKMEKYYDDPLEEIVHSNKKGARYTLVARDHQDRKYYYITDLEKFVDERSIERGVVPKYSIQELDQITSEKESIEELKGLPEDYKDVYISYQLNGEKRVPVITNDEVWKVVADSNSNKLKFKTKGPIRALFYKIYYELINPNSDFKKMLLDKETEKNPALSDSLRDAVKYLTSVIMSIHREMRSQGRDFMSNSEKINRSVGHDYLEKNATPYNELRALHTNYKAYKAGARGEKKAK